MNILLIQCIHTPVVSQNLEINNFERLIWAKFIKSQKDQRKNSFNLRGITKQITTTECFRDFDKLNFVKFAHGGLFLESQF